MLGRANMGAYVRVVGWHLNKSEKSRCAGLGVFAALGVNSLPFISEAFETSKQVAWACQCYTLSTLQPVQQGLHARHKAAAPWAGRPAHLLARSRTCRHGGSAASPAPRSARCGRSPRTACQAGPPSAAAL